MKTRLGIAARLAPLGAVALLALGLAAVARNQEPDPPAETPGGRGYPWDRIAEQKNSRAQDDLEGVWQLINLENTGLAQGSRGQHGIALVTRTHFSFELHIRWTRGLDEVNDIEFQSGIHSYEVDSLGNLVLTSMIGADLDANGLLQFQTTGQKRVYTMDLRNDALILTKPNGPKFTFKRLSGGANSSKYDIYGRRIPAEGEQKER